MSGGRSTRQRGSGDGRETAVVEYRPAIGARPAVEVHRSARRRRSGQAVLLEGRVVVRLPSGLPAAEEAAMVERLVSRVLRRHAAQDRGGDAALARRAARLADRYLDGVRATSVVWSARMQHRYGSCTPVTGEIRISDRLAAHPEYVLDYVLVHELAHLHVAGHGPAFDALVGRYPEVARAQGFLAGYEAGRLAGVVPPPAAVDD